MHRTLVLLPLVALVLLVGATRAHAALELEGGAYVQVRGYRYVEGRRFERGWNRGVDAVAVGGVVRAPVTGRVRFAGTVAGRGVLTLDAVVDDAPVVVTLTGVHGIAVPVDGEVRVGDAVARGLLVHVGAYDAGRRTRYLRVVVRTRAAATGDDGAGDRVAVRTVGDAIARRLADAIEGRAGPAAVSAATPRAASAVGAVAPGGSSASPSGALSIGAGSAVARAVAAMRAAVLAASPVLVIRGGRASGGDADAQRGPVGATRSASVAVIPAIAARAVARRVATGASGRAPRGDGAGAARSHAAIAGPALPPGSSTGGAAVPTAIPGGAPRTAGHAAARPDPRAPAVARAVTSSESTDGDDASGWRRRAAAVGTSVAACLLLVPLLRRRRRRSRVRRHAVVHLPRDPLLPTRPTRPVPRPHEPIEWTGVDPIPRPDASTAGEGTRARASG